MVSFGSSPTAAKEENKDALELEFRSWNSDLELACKVLLGGE